ncbi:MAG: helix-turn-helix transcriptional regulator [Candidatus Nanohaloarchaea archaeon]
MNLSDFDPVPEEFKPAVDEDRIATYILATNLDNGSEIAKNAGLHDKTVYRYLNEAAGSGILTKTKEGEYRATEELLDLLSSFDDTPQVEAPSEHHFDSIGHKVNWQPLKERLEKKYSPISSQNIAVEDRILETISKEGGKIDSMSVVAERIDISPTYVSQKISEMEEEGILQTQEMGRSKQVAIPESGTINPDVSSRREQIVNFIQEREGQVESLTEISEELSLTPRRISQIVSELEDDGVLEASMTGRSKTVRLRENFENQEEEPDRSAEIYLENTVEFEKYIEASQEIFGYQLEDRQELTFSDIMSHLSGEREIIDGKIRQSTEFLREKYDSEIFRTLNSSISLKILKEFQNFDSVMEMSDEFDIELETLKKGFSALGEAGVLSVEEHDYSIQAEEGKLYDDAIQIIGTAYRLSEYGNDEQENLQDSEPTEVDFLKENDEINRWIASLDLIAELSESSGRENGERAENSREMIDPESHYMAEIASSSARQSGDYQLVVRYLEENEGYLTLTELAEIIGWNKETVQMHVIEGQREDEIIGISKNGSFEVYLPEAYREARELDIQSGEGTDLDGAVYGKTDGNGQEHVEKRVELGEEIDPDELGHTLMDSRKYDERYRDIWTPRLKQKTGPGNTFTYEELADQTDWAPDQVRKTVAWMAYRGKAEVYENGVRVLDDNTTRIPDMD